jgi:hypothetical protein
MALTDYHAKYLAYELTKRCASDNVEKLTPVLADAQVDLTPIRWMPCSLRSAARSRKAPSWLAQTQHLHHEPQGGCNLWQCKALQPTCSGSSSATWSVKLVSVK